MTHHNPKSNQVQEAPFGCNKGQGGCTLRPPSYPNKASRTQLNPKYDLCALTTYTHINLSYVKNTLAMVWEEI